MSALRKHFEQRAAELANLSTLVTVEDEYSARLTVEPNRPAALGVVLYLFNGVVGTVSFDDQASVPAELGDDLAEDFRAIDGFIEDAREGRVTAFHIGRGGCTEVRDANGKRFRSWMNSTPLPGWRRRAERFDYAPYA